MEFLLYYEFKNFFNLIEKCKHEIQHISLTEL